MEDMMSKIQGMLSDEESLKQIKDLADMIMSPNDSGDESEEYAQNDGDNTSSSFKDENNGESSDDGLGFDIGMLLKLAGLFNSSPQGDKNTQLLLALKPLLKEEKQEKVDKAVKMMKLFAVWTVVKESGMLKDMF
ncbi:MAG TPA: hypothetical protein GX710_04900 [Clostridiales bacterium]|nr:hypothetical protein [Clostridiales bacterium]